MPRILIFSVAIMILVGLTCLHAADVTGKWTAEFDSQVGVQKYVFDLKMNGSAITGVAISNIGGAEAKTELKEGKITGDDITFVENLNYQDMELKIVYKGKVSGDEIKFSRDVGGQGGETFVAKRAK
jgi:hypothetical protein